MRQLGILLFVVLFFTKLLWASSLSDTDGIQISARVGHTCALYDEEVKCWGRNDYGERNVPTLKNPKSISAGLWHSCALDDEGVKCWGRNNEGQTNVLALKNPKSVSAGYRHSCALDDEGVKCWGENAYGQTNVPTLKNPKSVSAGDWYTCALDGEGVKCWGTAFGQRNVPVLKNTKSVSAGREHTCAVDDEGVKCWGDNEHGQTNVPVLKNPKSVSTGWHNTCAVDDEGVKCWGANNHGQRNVPALKNPKSVSTGTYHTCAVDDEGVKCWGDNQYGQRNVPPLETNHVRFPLPTLERSFLKLSRYVYAYKRDFFKKLSETLARSPIHSADGPSGIAYRQHLSRLFVLETVEPVLRTTSSPHMMEKVLPHFDVDKTSWSSRMGVASYQEIELLPPVFSLALTLTQLSLEASRGFLLDESKRQELEIMLTEVGLITAQFQNQGLKKQLVEELVQIFINHRSLIQVLAEEPRTQGFGALLVKLQTYLEGK